MQRTMTQRFLTTIAALAAFGAVGDVAAADVAAGKAKAAEVCAACHGADGNSATADFPRIGGQYGDYLAKALRDYKSGARKNAIMVGFVQTLIAKDMENVVWYFYSQPSNLASRY